MGQILTLLRNMLVLASEVKFTTKNCDHANLVHFVLLCFISQQSCHSGAWIYFNGPLLQPKMRNVRPNAILVIQTQGKTGKSGKHRTTGEEEVTKSHTDSASVPGKEEANNGGREDL